MLTQRVEGDRCGEIEEMVQKARETIEQLGKQQAGAWAEAWPQDGRLVTFEKEQFAFSLAIPKGAGSPHSGKITFRSGMRQISWRLGPRRWWPLTTSSLVGLKADRGIVLADASSR